MKYSITQGGNIGQAISMILVLIGYSSPEEAEAASMSVLTTIGIFTYVISLATSWYGRFRKGDINIFGSKN